MEMMPINENDKPKRLYYRSYLQMIKNSVGSEMFRNFYIQTPDGGAIDALDDGSNSCAFYVSSVLTLFDKNTGMHGTVRSTVKDLEKCSWQLVSEAQMLPGDVILWDEVELEGKLFSHLGFYIGEGRAVSTSWTAKKVAEHDVYFDGQRSIHAVYTTDWKS